MINFTASKTFLCAASVALLVLSSQTAYADSDSAASALDPAGAKATAAIQPEKKELILKYIKLSGEEKALLDEMQAVFSSMTKGFESAVTQSVKADSKVPDSDKEAVIKKSVDAYREGVTQIQEILMKKYDLMGSMDSVFMQAYDKYLTVDDLKVIVAYYESDAGKKLVAEAPQISDTVKTLTEQQVVPRVQAVVQQIIEEAKTNASSPAK